MFNYTLWAFTVITRDYINYSNNYAKLTLKIAVGYSTIVFFYLFYHKTDMLHYPSRICKTNFTNGLTIAISMVLNSLKSKIDLLVKEKKNSPNEP